MTWHLFSKWIFLVHRFTFLCRCPVCFMYSWNCTHGQEHSTPSHLWSPPFYSASVSTTNLDTHVCEIMSYLSISVWLIKYEVNWCIFIYIILYWSDFLYLWLIIFLSWKRINFSLPSFFHLAIISKYQFCQPKLVLYLNYFTSVSPENTLYIPHWQKGNSLCFLKINYL